MRPEGHWPLALYRRSVSKQEKFRQLARILGPTDGLRCLDLGVNSGAIGHMLRGLGGSWKSADVDAWAVEQVRELLGPAVFHIAPDWTPFLDGEFDRVVVVDLLEHLPDDRAFVGELRRVLKPDGKLIVNVPHDRGGWAIHIGELLGQTYRSHGHERPGYTVDGLAKVLEPEFEIDRAKTYSKFFAEVSDLVIRFVMDVGRRRRMLTQHRRSSSQWILLAYTLAYPLIWLISRLDALLVFQKGHRLLVEARPRGATG